MNPLRRAIRGLVDRPMDRVSEGLAVDFGMPPDIARAIMDMTASQISALNPAAEDSIESVLAIIDWGAQQIDAHSMLPDIVEQHVAALGEPARTILGCHGNGMPRDQIAALTGQTAAEVRDCIKLAYVNLRMLSATEPALPTGRHGTAGTAPAAPKRCHQRFDVGLEPVPGSSPPPMDSAGGRFSRAASSRRSTRSSLMQSRYTGISRVTTSAFWRIVVCVMLIFAISSAAASWASCSVSSRI